MFDSIVLYAALVIAILGAIALGPRRTRSKAGPVVIVALVVAGIVLVWPVRAKRATPQVTRLDAAMPEWQFDERHTIAIAAPPERVFDAVHKVTANEITLFRTLTTIRRGGRAGAESILNAPQDMPILDVATRTTFQLVTDDPPREVVVSTVITPPDAVLATMNFLVTPDGRGGSVLSTETRVNAIGKDAQRRFGIYWRLIHPGSDIIRRSWLRAVKRRAEAGSRTPPPPTPPSPR